MKHVTLPGGEVVPSMGQGTWKMGERAERRSDEIAALRAVVDGAQTEAAGRETRLAAGVSSAADRVERLAQALMRAGT